MGGTWKVVLADFFQDGDMRHFLSWGQLCHLASSQSPHKHNRDSPPDAGGVTVEKRLRGSSWVTHCGFCLSFLKTLLCCPPSCRCGAGCDISSTAHRKGHITPVFLHPTQLGITLWYMLNSVVWPLLVFLSKYPSMKCKHMLGTEKPGWWLWQRGEVTVECQRFEDTTAKTQKKKLLPSQESKISRRLGGSWQSRTSAGGVCASPR